MFISSTDFFAVSDFHFETLDEQLVENNNMPFSMSVTVTCTKPDCVVATATENTKLVLEFGASSPVQLADVSRAWVEEEQGRSVTPSLGTGFGYQRSSIKFAIKGDAKVSIIASCLCHLLENLCVTH